VKLGIEVLLEERLEHLAGKNVGLVTNPTGTDAELHSTAELLSRNPSVRLVALYGPEHGVRGNAQAGEHVPFYVDPVFKLPVFSLYGASRKPPAGALKDIDAYMRSFDTTEAEKVPERSMVSGLDVLVFDIQDVGARVYTYIATMAYCLEACAECGVEFVVLDRPNPIGGLGIEGPVLDYPAQSSFVGLYPIPLRHGMTVGELARLFNERFLQKKARLTVVPMQGWRRERWFDETGLPWVVPSPNMPTLETAAVYPGQVLLEGTNLSEGRGTTRPFELFGAPWIDGHALSERLNALRLPGVTFREAWFTPTFSKHEGKLCGGAQVHVTSRDAYRPVRTALHVIRAVREMYPKEFAFHADYFDKVAGTDAVRKGIEAGKDPDAILAEEEKKVEEFEGVRRAYLLY
jgi:uncharacterized protein YbbC (DUF1343 family)